MTILQAVILGIVEGVSEFLPISSTGHLILTSKIFGIAESSFTKSFEIAIQFGAILAVVVLYWGRFFSNKDLWKKVLTAFLPTAALGFLFYKILKEFLLSSSLVVLWSLFLGGIFLIFFELWYKKIISPNYHGHDDYGISDISYRRSFLIGIVQSLAIIPGVSRAGATIVGGLMMGIRRQAIVEFSFLLAVPTMAAATAYDLYKSAGSFSFDQFWVLTVGFFTSFIIAILAVKWLLRFIKNHTFIFFGVYRIIAAVLFWLLVL